MDVSSGEIPISAKGRTVILALKTKGLLAFQKHFSTATQVADLDKLLAKAMNGSIDHFTVLVWAACLKHQPTITLDEAIDFIDDAGGLVGIGAQFDGLIASTRPAAEDVKELLEGAPKQGPRKARTKATRGTGASSSSRPAASA